MNRMPVAVFLASSSLSLQASDDPASLDRLVDILVPPAVSWWPLATGWYLVIGLLLVFLSILIVAALLHRWRNAYRRIAIAELERVGHDPAALNRIAGILKRTALVIMPRHVIAALSGESWIQWLEQVAPGVRFSTRSRHLLTHQLYRNDVVDGTQLDELVSTACAWVRQHRLDELTDLRNHQE